MAGRSLSVFISYARTDSAFVDRLETDLLARNFQTWVDRRKLEGGQVWLDELEKAILLSQVLLVALSPDAVESKYVRMEYRYAQMMGKLVIPLYHCPCPRVPIDLNSLQWVDFNNDYNRGLNNLLIALSPVELKSIPNPSTSIQDTHTSLAFESKEPVLVAPQPAPPPQQGDLMALYRAGVIARAEGDFDRTEVLWKQILDRDPQFQRGALASQMKRLQEELHPLRVQRLSVRARQAYTAGEWEQAISAWSALLDLEPQDEEAQLMIPIAQYNQNFSWMYENALQFVQEGQASAAKLQLTMLWQDAPDYGDPAGLVPKLGLTLSLLMKTYYEGNYKGEGKKEWTGKVNIEIVTDDLQGNITGFVDFGDKLHKHAVEGTLTKDGKVILIDVQNRNVKYFVSVLPNGVLKGTFIGTGGESYDWEASKDVKYPPIVKTQMDPK